jgi:hypothetical protein
MTLRFGWRRIPTMLLALLLAACGGAAQAATYVMERDPGCPCCEEWAESIRRELGFEIATRDRPEMGAATANDEGVPPMLISCHSMEVEGYIIEGHVPAREIARLLRERPEGLSVAGMPAGSPGMEVASGLKQPYQVIAFGQGKTRVYASYP